MPVAWLIQGRFLEKEGSLLEKRAKTFPGRKWKPFVTIYNLIKILLVCLTFFWGGNRFMTKQNKPNHFKFIGMELAKSRMAVSYKTARILKPIFLMLCGRMIHPHRAFLIYFSAIYP
jgi:hypothetical protein